MPLAAQMLRKVIIGLRNECIDEIWILIRVLHFGQPLTPCRD